MAVKFLQNCLKKDTGTDASLKCIFYNNISGIYLTHGNHEKAFKYTRNSLYTLEPLVILTCFPFLKIMCIDFC